jgi:DNA-binding response OmpR family regulator
MKLLVIDNDRDFVEMLTGWLTTLGYEVHLVPILENMRCVNG